MLPPAEPVARLLGAGGVGRARPKKTLLPSCENVKGPRSVSTSPGVQLGNSAPINSMAPSTNGALEQRQDHRQPAERKRDSRRQSHLKLGQSDQLVRWLATPVIDLPGRLFGPSRVSVAHEYELGLLFVPRHLDELALASQQRKRGCAGSGVTTKSPLAASVFEMVV